MYVFTRNISDFSQAETIYIYQEIEKKFFLIFYDQFPILVFQTILMCTNSSINYCLFGEQKWQLYNIQGLVDNLIKNRVWPKKGELAFQKFMELSLQVL